MKKIICALITLLMVGVLCSCGNNEKTREPQDSTNSNASSSQSQKDDESSKNTPVTKKMYGYEYTFPEDVFVVGTSRGSLVECGNSTVFICYLDLIDFTDWESVISDSEYDFLGAIYSAFRIYPDSQNIVSKSEETNSQNEKLLHVEGVFDTSKGEKEFVAYYYVTNENKVRFFISIIDGNKEDVKTVTEYIAKNLAKA